MIKITLDTNCIINIFDCGSESSTSVEELVELVRYALEGDVNIAITTRVESDICKDKDDSRKRELLRRISIFPVIGTIFRLNNSKSDSGDILAGDDHLAIQEELKKLLFPNLSEKDPHYGNKINDVDHLIGHCLNKRDIFITDDKDILRKASSLKDNPGIVVMNPKMGLEYVNLKADRKVIVQEFYEKIGDYKKFLLAAIENKSYQDKQGEYTTFREWLIKKYPIIKDGLLQFKLKMLSVPVGGQMVFDQSDILGLQGMNEKIQKLFAEPILKEQIKYFSEGRGRYAYAAVDVSSPEDRIEGDFQNIIDLLIAYSGYLDKNY